MNEPRVLLFAGTTAVLFLFGILFVGCETPCQCAARVAKLGKRNAPALDVLVSKVPNDNPSTNATWLAAEAVGKIGTPAIEHIPLLNSKVGTGASQYDYRLRQAIERLEECSGGGRKEIKTKTEN